MTSDSERPKSPSFERGSSNDECTRPGDIAGPHYMSTCTLQSLNQLRDLCQIPSGIMAESMLPGPMESPESHRDDYFCVYEVYFKGCGLTFPLPEALIRYLAALRTILGIISVAAEAGYVIGVPELNELLSVRTFIAPSIPSEEFIEFFKIVLEGETLWNSFTLERFLEANHRLRMSPPGQLHQLPPPPSIQGMSSWALAAKRKALSKPIAEACEEKKEFLAASIDKKDYSRTLLVDDGSAEGARSAAAFRPTPRRERRGERSPRKARSPRRDSPRPFRDDFSNEPLKNLPDSEKTARSTSPKKGDSESRDASSKLKPVLVPQVKSLSESPPISESGLDWAGSSGTEDVVPPEVPAAPEVTPEDGCTVEGGPGAPSDQASVEEANDDC
ncbi:uncharacterized protein LOC110227164 [Arabidopsis lyrata subsp. lyrata]|uniref:uncharacterized protein LOC110227164 n=1 Tax=Arabidopsis lyrata subsp. lyrata TaxID=81972 RepID=UPI000A29E33B|nr:uncharacterized protein LOC110227164 [Arabidopsis lyrata subsp. lyrata]|eukprot:XP_020876212.1 uncharacterized protein LOC110227164 [Arabidopsis lyrata subsp. lyrata]